MPGRPPRPDGLAAELRRHLRTHRLIRPGDAVLVALSGGADSVALLHLLRFPLADLGLRLRAAHFDHAMRPGSAADAAWAAGVCRAWQVPFVARRAETPPYGEAAARDLRYAFLEETAGPGELIATAHHLDDQAETVLHRLIRGTGLRGLRAIAPRRGRVVRPLLGFTGAELRDYAIRARLRWREDPTNRELRFTRNRLRHRVMPELERVRPGAARGLAAIADHAREAEAAWQWVLRRLESEAVLEATPEFVVLARDVLRSYHPRARAGLLRHLLRRYGSMPGRAGTRAALKFINSGRSGAQLHLPGGVRLERDFDRVRITRAEPQPGERPVEIAGPSTGSARAEMGGRTVEVRWGPRVAGGGERIAIPQGTRFPLVVRGWRPGDRIRLAYGSKKLKKLFAERRLDRTSRRRTPVVADAEGRVLWVVGHARAAGVPDQGGVLEVTIGNAEQR